MNGTAATAGNAANASKTNTSSTGSSNKQQFKSNTAGKTQDGARKQAPSPVDNSSAGYVLFIKLTRVPEAVSTDAMCDRSQDTRLTTERPLYIPGVTSLLDCALFVILISHV